MNLAVFYPLFNHKKAGKSNNPFFLKVEKLIQQHPFEVKNT